MYQKRQIAYKMMAYQLNESHQKQTLFDNGSYEKAFREDLEQVHLSAFHWVASIDSQRIYLFWKIWREKNKDTNSSKT